MKRKKITKQPLFPCYGHLTHTEQLTKIIDEILCLWGLNAEGLDGISDYTACHYGFEAIRRARAANPSYPTTASLAKYLETRHLKESGIWAPKRKAGIAPSAQRG